MGRLGIASSYGAPCESLEEAFEQGCNYFVWNSFIKGRRSNMRQALVNIARKGQRDQLVLALHSYSHSSAFLDHIDVLLLGYYSRRPPGRIIERALKMQREGLVRFIGLTGHRRTLFPALAEEEESIEVFHVRYNAVNRGAETEVFPRLHHADRPGVVGFTATRWGHLLNPKRVPEGEEPPTAPDCYRFVLSHPGGSLSYAANRRSHIRKDAVICLFSGAGRKGCGKS